MSSPSLLARRKETASSHAVEEGGCVLSGLGMVSVLPYDGWVEIVTRGVERVCDVRLSVASYP